jgi:hypothetical protein
MAGGYTIDQVVHDYGDVCQAVTELASEQNTFIAVDEFHTLNRLCSANNNVAPTLTTPMADQATAGTKEYSWCNPPSTDFERTATPSPSRWRDSDGPTLIHDFGGSGTPGPKLLCGLPRL